MFLITLKAGGVGLNLTAADTVIHYDPWWNPAARRPGHRPRAPHRPGQAGVRLQADRRRHGGRSASLNCKQRKGEPGRGDDRGNRSVRGVGTTDIDYLFGQRSTSKDETGRGIFWFHKPIGVYGPGLFAPVERTMPEPAHISAKTGKV